jgi:major membrane immunogen (membrane-anchored lipoprotein)
MLTACCGEDFTDGNINDGLTRTQGFEALATHFTNINSEMVSTFTNDNT